MHEVFAAPITVMLSLAACCVHGMLLMACAGPNDTANVQSVQLDTPRTQAVVFAPPALDALAGHPRRDQILLGYQLVVSTQEVVRPYVGNGLNCANCHLDAGRQPHAGPFVGLSAVFPEYRSRNARMNTLEERLDDCFERSMNGRPLPRDSREMEALVAYIDWLSEGISKGTTLPWRGFPRIPSGRPPDLARGESLFGQKCAGCHGADGHGTPAGPPVWGPQSYNIAAGMARVSLAAAFIKRSMPLGQGGTLSNEEAYDLAAFIDSRPRPDFPKKHLDWPKGGKPADSPY